MSHKQMLRCPGLRAGTRSVTYGMAVTVPDYEFTGCLSGSHSFIHSNLEDR